MNSFGRLKRRQSLNFVELDNSHVGGDNKGMKENHTKPSRVVSVSRMGEEEKIKFKEVTSKMYIEKR